METIFLHKDTNDLYKLENIHSMQNIGLITKLSPGVVSFNVNILDSYLKNVYIYYYKEMTQHEQDQYIHDKISLIIHILKSSKTGKEIFKYAQESKNIYSYIEGLKMQLIEQEEEQKEKEEEAKRAIDAAQRAKKEVEKINEEIAKLYSK